ncbi:hypothetical protein WMO13_06490 [Ignatzschineria larvae DSM 13226]|uniref:Uncharacterized protein n=1 Tax=Ignatzschineria larvae DSM 13226 TaxID=1111732 RepID=A0ABZ3BWY3_9GAMM|nr:hypothetical protein [Ignatzschineria larvae]
MSLFTESFQKGIENANKVEKQKREIEEVFKELDREILNATEGIISIEIKENTRVNIWGTQKRDENFLKQYTALIAIVLKQDSKQKSYELAEIKTADNGGYPCRVIFDNQSNEALDKQSLRLIISDMLSSPKIGMIFNELLKHYQKVRNEEEELEKLLEY